MTSSLTVLKETWNELISHTGTAGNSSSFPDALMNLCEGHRFRADDKSVMQILAVLNLYGITMYLECILAANFASLYAQNATESESWRGTFANKLLEMTIFLEAQTTKLDKWIEDKQAERLSCVTDISDNTTSENIEDTYATAEAVGVTVVGQQYTDTYQFKDQLSEKTYKGRFITRQLNGERRDFSSDESFGIDLIRSARRTYLDEVRLHCERRFATLKKAIAIYRKVASEMRAFNVRVKTGTQAFPSGVELYNLLIGKTDNPTLIGPGGVLV